MENYHKGRGAQINPANPYLKQEITLDHQEGIDEPFWLEKPETQVFIEHPKKILNKVKSPDIGLAWSANPYQGCEHGCIYCYARNTHTYWGWSAGLDFETKIIVKENAPTLIETAITHPKWKVEPISLSGNTDCYQPLEKKYRLTRGILEVCLKYRHPVGIITKNALVERDIDILQSLAELGLVHVYFSITTLNEKLRSVLEPRTATTAKKLALIRKLSALGIPVGIMNAPIIPGLNEQEIPVILKASAEAGALRAGYTVIRLNGQVGDLFYDWVKKNFPERAGKVLQKIKNLHGGKVNDSRWGKRMQGDGEEAMVINRLFHIHSEINFKGKEMPPYNLKAFIKAGQLNLFT